MRLPDVGEIEHFASADAVRKIPDVHDSAGLRMTGLAVARGPKRDTDALCGMLRQVYDINDQLPFQMQAALDALAKRLAEHDEQTAAVDQAEPMLAPTSFAFA